MATDPVKRDNFHLLTALVRPRRNTAARRAFDIMLEAAGLACAF
jgi:hypothetical protein